MLPRNHERKSNAVDAREKRSENLKIYTFTSSEVINLCAMHHLKVEKVRTHPTSLKVTCIIYTQMNLIQEVRTFIQKANESQRVMRY